MIERLITAISVVLDLATLTGGIVLAMRDGREARVQFMTECVKAHASGDCALSWERAGM